MVLYFNVLANIFVFPHLPSVFIFFWKFFFFGHSSHVFRLSSCHVSWVFFYCGVPKGKADLKGFTRLHEREFHCRHPERQWRQQCVSLSERVPPAWVLVLPSIFFEGGGSFYVYSAGWNIFMHIRKCNFAHKCDVLLPVWNSNVISEALQGIADAIWELLVYIFLTYSLLPHER